MRGVTDPEGGNLFNIPSDRNKKRISTLCTVDGAVADQKPATETSAQTPPEQDVDPETGQVLGPETAGQPPASVTSTTDSVGSGSDQEGVTKMKDRYC